MYISIFELENLKGSIVGSVEDVDCRRTIKIKPVHMINKRGFTV